MGADRMAVGVLFPGPSHAGALDSLRAPELDHLDLRFLDWADPPEVSRAKATGSRSRAWIIGHETPVPEALRRELADTEVLLALDLPVDITVLAPRLRWVQGVGAGVGQLVHMLDGTGVTLCSAAGASAVAIAEFVMARLLSVWKDLRAFDDLQRGRRWPGPSAAPSSAGVAGRTLCVVGTGAIGQEIARRAAAFDLRVVGVRRRPELGPPPHFDRVVGPDRFTELLGESDAVVLAAPATDRTAGLVGRGELALLPAGAVLCNVARGSLVDEAALVDALDTGHLRAAILDVTAVEPLSRRSPLWAHPGVHLSPHASSLVPGYFSRVADVFADNLRRDREGRPLRNVVDLAEGY